MPQRSRNDVSTNLELRAQLVAVQTKLNNISGDAQRLIDNGVKGAKMACQSILKNVGRCTSLTHTAETNADRMTPEGCSSYSLTRLINSNKRKLLLLEEDIAAPNLRQRFTTVDDISFPHPISGKFSAIEACEILIRNKGKGNVLIKYFEENNMIPIKLAMMYRIFNFYKKADDSVKKTITWNNLSHCVV